MTLAVYQNFIIKFLKNQNKIKLYNNVRYTLNHLKKIKIGNRHIKNKIRTLKLIKKFCLKFDIIVAKEPKFIGKPHPEINFALKKLNIKKKKMRSTLEI
ncbi:MAG: hypothetical protein CM15mP14_1730 [Rhodospirillaceae bacterium]|nr:MAG: hypothetical protein CM15mP14_1730 [Rhodospirillaceae bacterium]